MNIYKTILNNIKQLNGIRRLLYIIVLNLFNYGFCFCMLISLYGVLDFFIIHRCAGLSQTASLFIVGLGRGCFGLCAYLFCYFTGVKSYQPHVESTGRRFVLWSLYAIVVILIILMMFHWVFIRIDDIGMQERVSDVLVSDIPFIPYLFYVFLIAPFSEEFIFRLFMYNQLKRTSSWWVAMLFVSSFFAISHNTTAHTFLALIFGIFLTLSYEVNGSPVVNIIYHICYNVISVLFDMPDIILNNNFIMPVLFVLLFVVIIFQCILLNSHMVTVPYHDWDSAE